MSPLMELEERWPVVVVGGGPAGSAAAIGCARAGLRVLQVDEKPFPRRKVCGGCLNQVSLRLLEDLLGEDDRLWSAMQPLGGFAILHRGREFRFETPPGRAVERAELDAALVQKVVLSGGTFRDGTRAQLGAAQADGRQVMLHAGTHQRTIVADVVVLAAGLGNRGWQVADQTPPLEIFRQSSPRHSRVGIEAILSEFPAKYADGTIHMVVGREGYVGLTEIAGQRLHVAAAVQREALKRYGPHELVGRLLRQSGSPQLESAAVVGNGQVQWRGTPPLTAKPDRLGAERVLLVGDAAGYVEPFTGEGIRWALESGCGVVPFIARLFPDNSCAAGKSSVDSNKPVCTEPVSAEARPTSAWDSSIVRDWEQWYDRTIRREQRLCRSLAAGLKQPLVCWLAHYGLRIQPRFASAIISRLNGTHSRTQST